MVFQCEVISENIDLADKAKLRLHRPTKVSLYPSYLSRQTLCSFEEHPIKLSEIKVSRSGWCTRAKRSTCLFCGAKGPFVAVWRKGEL